MIHSSRAQESVIPRRSRGICSAAAYEAILRLHHVEQIAAAYTEITGKLQKRVFEHKDKLLDGFTARYNFDMLVYYEEFSQVASAITREKQIKSSIMAPRKEAPADTC